MRTADLTELIDTDEIVIAEDDGRTYYGLVTATETTRYTNDHKQREDGVQIRLTDEEGTFPVRPVRYTPQVELDASWRAEIKYDERDRRRRVNAHNSRPIVDDFGNVVTEETKATIVLAPVQVKRTMSDLLAEQERREREAAEAEARRKREAEEDEKRRRFVRAYLVDLVGDVLAKKVERFTYDADDLRETVEAIEAAEVTEIQTNVYRVSVTKTDFGRERTETTDVLVLDSDEVADEIDNEGRFIDLDRGSSSALGHTETQINAFAAIAAQTDVG